MVARLARIVSAACLAGTLALASTHAARANVDARFTSPSLSAFFGRPIEMRAEIALPDSEGATDGRRYPTIYAIPAFRGAYRPTFREDAAWRAALRAAGCRCAVVYLDASQPYGHDEFVDSSNDGPWERALETEFIPYLESHAPLATSAAGRFLVGHSSGGWSALWLQIARPEFYGGAWAIAPDPLDFHDFTGIDLSAVPPQNFYRDAAGERGFVRVAGRDTSTIRAYVAGEAARGPGGQFDSFEAVFGPRGADGRPARLFDRTTGAIDPAVAAYWSARFDLTRRVRETWPRVGPRLAGKLHVFVGTEDTFHLETSVARFAAALREVGGDARAVFVPGADHFSIFGRDGALLARIAREIEASNAGYTRPHER
ncbi:MAG: hypothetical protein NVSMB21_11130 [Vulcanimicrobiaceae bacterium]